MAAFRMLLIVTLAVILFRQATAAENTPSAVRSATLLMSNTSWDGKPYKSSPPGQPELSVLKITLQPHTKLEWHSHPIPSAAYIVAGELTVERKKTERSNILSPAKRFRRQWAHSTGEWQEGNEPVVFIVF